VVRRKKVNKNIFEEDGKKKERIKVVWQGRAIAMGLDKSDVGWICVEPLFTHKELETYMGASQWHEWCPGDFNKKYELVPANGFLLESFAGLDELPGHLKDARETRMGTVCRWVKMYDVIGKFHLNVVTPLDFRRKVQAKRIPKRNSYYIRPVELNEGE
jgi:hypothetical protein